ncbi:hypothetical protein AURANDRAFT_71427 [Aureococcus anophagefferens]|uniref:Nucleotide-diphospho-sugar transferase domain-containing protein n=1 Tax=Aureococcus anophagefferens TaxID=44056 RepID=F0Y710_AURAN|nr:hypothetical protein AURANDRAFT_71427 [Aureococcus anophagefferens]EGB09318.1 hypothetical protein AURANDRAFT_71427 [Aureococcus anophagefferens]|eukprot:XP_009036414.1 hypothetical protein AURANDRAFT_71427 [Aureococcus anophagefferens]
MVQFRLRALLSWTLARLVLHDFALLQLTNASHDKFGNSRSSTRRSRRYDAGSEDRTHRSSSKPRPPPESYLSTKWIHSVIAANDLSLRASAPQRRGVVYVAVGSTSLQKAFKSARSVRLTNSANEIGSLLVTDSNGKMRATRWSSNVFDCVVDVGRKSAQLRFDEMHEFEGFRKKKCEGAPGECVNTEIPDVLDSWHDERLSKSSMILKRLRILKVRTFMLGLQLYHTILFLDTDTVVCAPLGRMFEALDAPRKTPDTQPSHVAFVPVPKGHTHGHEVISKIFAVPADFPEANTGVIVVRNSSATKRLLANWNIAYHVLARHSSRLMDQPAFRVSLFRSAVGYRELPASANCRGRNRRTKLAIPLVCDGFREPSDNLAAKFGAGRNCVILHSHELSIQTAEGPAAGNSVKELFVKGFLKEHRSKQLKGSKTQSLHIDTRREWDLNKKLKKVLREPAARIVSEHKYCHAVDFEDQCCTGQRGAANRELRINPLETRRGREGAANAADLQFIIEHLEEWFAVIGITERFEESMALFSFALTGKLMPQRTAGSVHTHNQNTSTSSLDLSVLRRINEAVKLDIELYRAALSLFERQLDSLRLRDLRRT